MRDKSMLLEGSSIVMVLGEESQYIYIYQEKEQLTYNNAV